MLKYSVRLNGGGNLSSIDFKEGYVDSALSYFTGVTSPSYGLVNKSDVVVVSKKYNRSDNFGITANNVVRQGYVVLRGFKYPVDRIFVASKKENVNTVYIDGRYFYEVNGKYKITRWYVENFSREYRTVIEDGKEVKKEYLRPCPKETTVEVSASDGYVSLDRICWIEDGKVTIDGDEYFFDPEEMAMDGSIGGLRYEEDGPMLTPQEIAGCDVIDCVPFELYDWNHTVTKFRIGQSVTNTIKVDNISGLRCECFVTIDGVNYTVKLNKEGGFYVRIGCDDYPVVQIVSGEDEEPRYSALKIGEYTYNGRDYVNTLDDLHYATAYVVYDGAAFVVNSVSVETDRPSNLVLFLSNSTLRYNYGDRVLLVSSGKSLYVYGDDGNEYVVYNGKKYFVIKDLIKKVVIDDEVYDAELTHSGISVRINDEWIPMQLDGTTVKRYGKVLNKDRKLVEQTGEVVSYPGYLINGIKVEAEYYETEENGEVASIQLNLPDTIQNKYPFFVVDVSGSSMLTLKADVRESEFTPEEEKEYESSLYSLIMSNRSSFSMISTNSVLGDREVSPDIGFLMTDNPTSSDDYYNAVEEIDIFVNADTLSIDIPLSNDFANNVLQSELIEKDFHKKVLRESINETVDMEKDVYVPKFIATGNQYNGSKTVFSSILEIRVNLHFRTRNLDSWKVIDKNTDILSEGVRDNWFVTDYEPYKTMISNGERLDELMKLSDLIGLLSFDNNDIYYQKSRVGKSFLRFSFYDSPNPQKQMLLSTSTVFVDEHDLFKVFIDNSITGSGPFTMVSDDVSGCSEIKKINVLSERGTLTIETVKEEGMDVQQITKFQDIVLDSDSERLSSRFTIKNKYETDTSSEGFYMYMFKQYSENLHPKPIYMKVEFNHAGVGRTIPFIIPMKWVENENGDYVTPERPLTLAEEDIETLKKGVPLPWVYTQTYIPLYAVYDYLNKEYAYVFDNRYVKVNEKDNSIDLNLFELKIRDDSDLRGEDGFPVKPGEIKKDKDISIKRDFKTFPEDSFVSDDKEI